MVEHPFLPWFVANWARVIAFACFVMVLTYLLVAGAGVAFHRDRQMERQSAQLEKIEGEAVRTREEAARTRLEVQQIRGFLGGGE